MRQRRAWPAGIVKTRAAWLMSASGSGHGWLASMPVQRCRHRDLPVDDDVGMPAGKRQGSLYVERSSTRSASNTTTSAKRLGSSRTRFASRTAVGRGGTPLHHRLERMPELVRRRPQTAGRRRSSAGAGRAGRRDVAARHVVGARQEGETVVVTCRQSGARGGAVTCHLQLGLEKDLAERLAGEMPRAAASRRGHALELGTAGGVEQTKSAGGNGSRPGARSPAPTGSASQQDGLRAGHRDGAGEQATTTEREGTEHVERESSRPGGSIGT